jgi:VWFA-related protein
MRIPETLLLAVILGLTYVAASAEQPAPQPSDAQINEQVEVNLVQVDALVMDDKGRTVAGLGKDDFRLRIGSTPLEISTLDVVCPIGSAKDPLPIKDAKAALPKKIAPGTKRRVVFAFDYYHLTQPLQAQVLEAAEAMLRIAKTDEEELMIVALAYGVRVEQRFTSDTRQLIATLDRMEHDVSLWGREFRTGTTGEEYFKDLTTLMDVVAAYGGSKAVVLFSDAEVIEASMRDIWYNDVAMHAAAARAAIYPAKPNPLGSSGVSDALARFANQSGGRAPFFAGDLSVPYRWAQRDLSCRYTVGAYIDPNDGGPERREIHLGVTKPGAKIRHPEMIRFFTDEELGESRRRAAFVDPGPYENPLVRAFAFPINPATDKKWDTLVAVNFPAPVGAQGVDVDVAARILEDAEPIDKFDKTFHIGPAPDSAQSRPVTLLGDSKLKDGQYEINVVLSEKEDGTMASAEAHFTVPQVLDDLLILRGPILARVVPGGMLVWIDTPKGTEGDTRLNRVLGQDTTFEPLLVHQIDSGDDLLFYWNACVHGQSSVPSDAVVKRTFFDADGEIALELDSIPFALESRGKQLACQDNLERLSARKLAPGEYELDVVVASSQGEAIARSTAPLHIK